MLLTMFVLAGLAWIFIWVTGEVVGGDSHALDEQLLMSMRSAADPSDPLGPHWVEELMRDITGLGGVGVLTFLTLVVVGFLILQNKGKVALVVVVTIGSGIALSLLMKMGFDRPRPELVPHESYVYTTSFPSGHSMMSAVVYLSLASLLARVQQNRRVKIYLVAVAMVLTMMIGVSRVYMGVHWPTDVLAGWMAGAFWALLCYMVTRHLQHSGAVEPEGLDVDPDAAKTPLTVR
ncbi:MAG: PA-phosphatase [unclassified Hahellaceae]|nr:PA-phosphatase [Hahellaceae bacterium]|tara:strand:+ start:19890 stop:20591 length:702 start_codon:yes stop_codon:yes gene_type:complete